MRNIRSVLLQLDDTPSGTARLAFALRFAHLQGAALSAMLLRWPHQQAVQRYLSESGEGVHETMEPVAAGRPWSWFEDVLSSQSMKTRLLRNDDLDPIQTFCDEAADADLLILGAHTMPSGSERCTAASFTESVLMSTDKPALILPVDGNFGWLGQDVLVGWDGTPLAPRTTGAVLPWLRAARRVHVLQCCRPATGHTSPLDIARYMQFHGIAASVHSEPDCSPHGGERLLAYASDVKADLLVMVGCCGQSRARGLMHGGACRDVLRSMTLPVLMAH